MTAPAVLAAAFPLAAGISLAFPTTIRTRGAIPVSTGAPVSPVSPVATVAPVAPIARAAVAAITAGWPLCLCG